MVYDEIVGNIPRRVIVEWETPGDSIRGTVLNINTSNEPYRDSVKVYVRMEDGTIASFYAPTDLKGKIHPEDVGKYVEVTYLGPEKLPADKQGNEYVAKKFRVLREVAYQRPPKKNGVGRSGR